MSTSETTVSAALRGLAAKWLNRPLNKAELQELDRFVLARAGAAPETSATSAAPAPANPAALARAQTEQLLDDGRQRTALLIRDVLQRLRATAEQALQAQEREEQAILNVVQAARSLGDLRPSALAPAASNLPSTAQLALPQIADRLANLVKSEVERCFQQSFGPLQQQLAEAIRRVDAAGAAQAPAPATNGTTPPASA